jgi:DNA polymerase
MTRHLPQDWPEKWAQFVSYNGQDVVAERTIRKRLADWTPTGAEREIWRVDQGINDRGVRVDLTLARQAVTMDGTYKGELTAQAVALTGLENPNSVAQVKAWLAEQEGQEFPSLNKKAVADVVARLTLENTKQFLALRSELAKSSTKKYDAILRAACRDEHVRGCFQFCGAGRTGRWAGRLVQLQNLAKNKMEDLSSCRALVRAGDLDGLKLLYGNVTGCLSELIRTALIPEQGHRFLVCDYSAIEARVLSWIAGEEWALEEFRGDGLIYEATGARMFGVPKLSIAKGGENHHLRPAAKTAELACGYGGGMGAMKAFGADKMGMSDEDILRAVDLWREAHPNVRKLWKSLERAAIRCVVQGTPQVSETGKIRFDLERGILWMTLPSGRRIAYFGARYGEGTGPYTKGKKVLSYMGVDQQSHKWTRVETFSGKLTENLVQATARDCLRDAMIALDAAGFDIRAHIHDEVIISEPIGGRGVPDVAEIMGRTPSWAPGLPLRGDGYACDFYMKD